MLQQPAYEPEPTSPTPELDPAAPAVGDGELAEEAHELAVAAERPPKRRAWVRYVLMLAVLALAIRLVIPQLGPLQDSFDVLRTMVPAYLALAVVAQVASYWWSGVMTRDIVRLTGDEVGTWRATAISVGSGSVGLVAGGALGSAGATFRWLRDVGVSPEGALLASWLPTLLNAATVVIFGLIGTAELMLEHGLSMGEMTALGIAFGLVLVCCLFLAWAARHPAPAESLAVRLARRWGRIRRRTVDEAHVRERVGATYEALDLLRRKGWKRPMVDSVLMQAFDALTLWLVFVAMLDVISPHVFMAGYGIPMLISKFGVIPGGVGLIEGMMVAIFHHVGEQTRVAVLAVVAYRLIAFWIPNLAGFGFVPFLQAGGRRRARAQA